MNIRAEKGKGKELYRKILAEKKKFIPKTAAPQKSAKAESKKKADNAQSDSSSDGGAIREIRKMYEDGIITKEEMMELLKAQLSK
jgi:hypothetical protein